MLTNADIRRELDAAQVGPVIEIVKLAELIGSGKSMLYHLIARRELVKASGRGVVTRDSLEKFLGNRQEFFCKLYERNHRAEA